MNLIVGITGATGVVLGIKLLKELRRRSRIRTHLIISKWAEKLIAVEEKMTSEKAVELADHHYQNDDLTAPITSGSYPIDGMIVIPCTTGTLAKIANGYSDNLITRAAAVALKEKRKLVLVVRETPLSVVHLENMLKATRAGAIVLPPVLAFYHEPETIDDVVKYVVGKALDLFDIEHDLFCRWRGVKREERPSKSQFK